jgi:hypothetical protein
MLALLLAAVASGTTAAPPVFTKDIAPILYKHCAGCHHEGEVAPFPLIGYEDARKRAGLIAKVTRTRLMPPWKPVAGFNHFEGERRLSALQIATLQRWAATGAREGDPAKLPPAPVFANGWQLGEPDLVVTLPMPFAVPADGADIYQCFVLPMNVRGQRFIRAAEFRPSNRRVVHHALLFTDASRIPHEPQYPCFGSIGLLPTLGVGGWSPGNEAIRVPEGAALPLAANSRLVAQVHYHPSGKPEADQWSVGLYFTDQAPVRRVVDVGVENDRYPGGRIALCGEGAFHDTDRGGCGGDHPACASVVPGDAGLGDLPGWVEALVAEYQRLGFQLAGSVEIREANSAAGGYAGGDGVCV